jgi:phospholipid-binding lipoprotein MlaA
LEYIMSLLFPLRRFGSAAATIALLLIATALSGCATTGHSASGDPIEPANRPVFEFNQGLDHKVVRPVAEGYEAHVPAPVRSCVRNVFSNLGDILTSANQLLQGEPAKAGSDISRFGINTTVGVLGCFDPASSMGLAKHKRDFGETLALWGVPPGPYVVLPLLGPSTVRDVFGLVPGWFFDPTSYVAGPAALALKGTQTVSTRSSNLKASDLIDSAALDPYLFTRDAFLAHRLDQIYDGHPPIANAGSAKPEPTEPMPGTEPSPSMAEFN